MSASDKLVTFSACSESVWALVTGSGPSPPAPGAQAKAQTGASAKPNASQKAQSDKDTKSKSERGVVAKATNSPVQKRAGLISGVANLAGNVMGQIARNVMGHQEVHFTLYARVGVSPERPEGTDWLHVNLEQFGIISLLC